jgi:antitoxin VapB
MGINIKNRKTDALARKVAAMKKTSLTEAIPIALEHELARQQARPTLVEIGVQFCRDLRARSNPVKGKPASKRWRDNLYEGP